MPAKPAATMTEEALPGDQPRSVSMGTTCTSDPFTVTETKSTAAASNQNIGSAKTSLRRSPETAVAAPPPIVGAPRLALGGSRITASTIGHANTRMARPKPA